MTLGARIDDRRKVIGISQAELARRVGVRQSTINGLINGDARSSRSIVAIARELHTTPAYLTGDIDDAEVDAAPPPAAYQYQAVTLQALLPSETVLTAAFEAVLLASPRMSRGELARELAKRLPTLLRVAAGALAAPLPADDAVPPATEEDRDDDRRAPRRASRT